MKKTRVARSTQPERPIQKYRVARTAGGWPTRFSAPCTCTVGTAHLSPRDPMVGGAHRALIVGDAHSTLVSSTRALDECPPPCPAR